MGSISAVTQHKVQRYFGSYISGLVLGFITSIWSSPITGSPRLSKCNLVSSDEPTQSVKDYSQPLYCKICHVQCNSDSMLETHLNGSKHLKKMKQLGQEDVSTGTNSTSKKVLAATAKSVKNVPKFVSLETKLHLERRGEPVIGWYQMCCISSSKTKLFLFFQLSLRHDRFVSSSLETNYLGKNPSF